MVGDEHQGPAREGPAHSASRIRDDQDLDAQLGKDPGRQAGDGRRMALVQMKAARLHDDRHALELPSDQFSLVACDAWLGESGDGAIRNANRRGDFVGEKAEARAENDRDTRF